MTEEEQAAVRQLAQRVDRLALQMERAKFNEYVEMLNRPRHLFYVNFISGVWRGLGMAVGFTFIGALVVYLLNQVVMLNLPGISGFIAEIVRMVEEQAYR